MKQEEFNKFLKSGEEIPDKERKTLTAEQESFYSQLEAYCLSVAIEKDLNTRCLRCGSKNLKISYPSDNSRQVFCFDCKYKLYEN